MIKDKGDQQEAKRPRTKWITDFLVMSEFNKIVVGTGLESQSFLIELTNI